MKIDKLLISIIIFILLLSFVTYWQFKNFQKTLSEVKLPSLEMSKFEMPLFQENKEYKEFVSPDGKLKLKYSSDWMEMPKESLKNFDQEAIKEGQTLFLASKFKIEKTAFALLIIQELEKRKNPEEIIEEIQSEAKEKGGEVEIISLDIKENRGYFEAKYKRKGGTFRSKEKIILGENKFYLISIFSLEKDWPEFQDEANEILDSVQLTP